MNIRINNKAVTFSEILVVSLVAVCIVAAVTSFYSLTNRTSSIESSEQWLQQCANTILTKIVEGASEPGGVFRLSEATEYTVVSLSELRFKGTDGIDRTYRLNAGATSVIYHHPTSSFPAGEDQIIFTAPSGTTITLRFYIPAGAQYTGVVVGIDAALTQNISGRAISGCVSTYVNIRNHSVS